MHNVAKPIIPCYIYPYVQDDFLLDYMNIYTKCDVMNDTLSDNLLVI
jgi:hypothetical protein